jgi:hypothetical protein
MSGTKAAANGHQTAEDITFRAAQAIDGARPLFLIVYYEHEAVKIAFLKTLAKTLNQAEITPQTFDPSQRPDHGAGRLYPLLATAAANRTLALIASIPLDVESSAPAASFLAYLNLHRDQIHRDKLRIVLFLHSSDAACFMANAGDLWDFRHHTYWLEGASAHDGASLWQSLELGVQETALLEQDKEEIARHIESVRTLIEQTVADEEKAALLLELSSWRRRRGDLGH